MRLIAYVCMILDNKTNTKYLFAVLDIISGMDDHQIASQDESAAESMTSSVIQFGKKIKRVCYLVVRYIIFEILKHHILLLIENFDSHYVIMNYVIRQSFNKVVFKNWF